MTFGPSLHEPKLPTYKGCCFLRIEIRFFCKAKFMPHLISGIRQFA